VLLYYFKLISLSSKLKTIQAFEQNKRIDEIEATDYMRWHQQNAILISTLTILL